MSVTKLTRAETHQDKKVLKDSPPLTHINHNGSRLQSTAENQKGGKRNDSKNDLNILKTNVFLRRKRKKSAKNL